jgi:hypothetical protein
MTNKQRQQFGRQLRSWMTLKRFLKFAYGHIDLRTGRVSPALLHLDDPVARAALVFQTAWPPIVATALEGLLACKQSLNDMLQSAGRCAQSANSI